MNAPACELPQAVCVDPDRIGDFWPYVRGLIKGAIERGDLGTFDAIEKNCFSGVALVWLAWRSPNLEGVAVTELIKTERSKSCVIVACAGVHVSRWLPLLREIENYARAEGCDAVRVYGRKGWSKILQGYLPKKVILERKL